MMVLHSWFQILVIQSELVLLFAILLTCCSGQVINQTSGNANENMSEEDDGILSHTNIRDNHTIYILLFAIIGLTGATVIVVVVTFFAKLISKKCGQHSASVSIVSGTHCERRYSDLPPSYSDCENMTTIVEGAVLDYPTAPDIPPPAYESILKGPCSDIIDHANHVEDSGHNDVITEESAEREFRSENDDRMNSDNERRTHVQNQSP
ncbi:uncharacterized protein LOC144439437 [Glandiceps talaboti]